MFRAIILQFFGVQVEGTYIPGPLEGLLGAPGATSKEWIPVRLDGIWIGNLLILGFGV